MIVVREETPDQPDVLAFLRQADERSSSLYPAGNRHGLSMQALLAAKIRFFVARENGVASGCGGYAPLTGQRAELKRLFVDPAARGRGIGRTLVLAAEASAVTSGIRTMMLETGTKSSDAIRLYHRLSYRACEPFGPYAADPDSIFMEKHLAQEPGEL